MRPPDGGAFILRS